MAKQEARVTVDGRELTVSNLDKVLFPQTGFTKGQLIDYYVKVAQVMLPHISDRPLTMKRYPNGVDEKYFYEKHKPVHAPDWVRSVRVPTSEKSGEVEYSVVCDLPTLVWAANLGTIEFHVPLWRVGRARRLPAPPDLLVFDLDPGEGTTVVDCCRIALWIEEVLTGQGSETRVKTSGSKGLQVYATLGGRPTWEKSRSRALDIAQNLEREHPELVVSSMRKALRRDKVLIDWSQNHQAKTTVAAYSVRARSEPTVSTPVSWKEVRSCLKAKDPSTLRFTTDEVVRRVEKLGDLFAF